MPGVKDRMRSHQAIMDTVPSDEEFVAAVIRVHERLLSSLRALARGDGWRQDPADPAEGVVIQAYSTAHGVPLPAALRF
jgi:hypothetical protein